MTTRAHAIPWIVACALLMQNLDSTAVTTAVPQMAHALGVAPIRLGAAVTAYVLAVAVFLPASGYMADRFGARSVFAAAIGLFTLASMACGLAPDLTTLVLARIMQGLGGAMMVPVGRLILVRSVPRDQLIHAMARTTTPALIGPALGPLVGGWLTSYASWRWIFFVNLPIGIAGIVLVLWLVPDTVEDRGRAPGFDIRGFVLSGLGLGCLVAGLEAAGRADLSVPMVALMLGTGGFALWAYARHARQARHPVIDLSIFGNRTFVTGVVAGSLFRLGAGALPFLMPMLLQVCFGLSPIASGALTFTAAIGALASKSLARPLLRRFGFRRVLVCDSLASGIVLGAFALFDAGTAHGVIMLGLVIGGMLRSIQFTAMNSLTYAEIAPAETNRANTLTNVAQQLSFSVGIALAATGLHLAQMLEGGTRLDRGAFVPVFLLFGVTTALSGWCFGQLDRDVGADMAGRSATGLAAPAPVAD